MQAVVCLGLQPNQRREQSGAQPEELLRQNRRAQDKMAFEIHFLPALGR
jgi:hypothetical protein